MHKNDGSLRIPALPAGIYAKLIAGALAVIALLYAAFLILDVFASAPALSGALKYAGVLLCLFIALISYHVSFRKRDCLLLIAALCFTALADMFLLFTDLYLPGVLAFIAAHMIYLVRYSHKALCVGLAFTQFAAGLSLVIGFFFEIACALYAVLIITVTVSACFAKHLPKQNAALARAGMFMFLLCDVNVALYNILPSGDAVYAAASVLMWFFYMPAQALLALSAVAWE